MMPCCFDAPPPRAADYAAIFTLFAYDATATFRRLCLSIHTRLCHIADAVMLAMLPLRHAPPLLFTL